MILHNFLNRRLSIQNLSDEQFESVVDQLAQELEQYPFIPQYTEENLRTDWIKLVRWNSSDNHINS
ncbi:MAG: hypothetical protein EBU90_31055, partial [Proteobacteria bacterium]|nr:hypothetical protein [Pseudomonadota bacterium]